jgi:hypothetical protein
LRRGAVDDLMGLISPMREFSNIVGSNPTAATSTMQHKLTISVPVYDFTCEITFASEIEVAINKVRKKQSLEPIEGTVHGYAFGTNSVHKYYLFYSLQNLSVNTLVHEISHLIDFVFTDREIDPPTGETRAYLTGHVTSKIFEFVYKKDIKTTEWLKAQNQKQKQLSQIKQDIPNSQTNNSL